MTAVTLRSQDLVKKTVSFSISQCTVISNVTGVCVHACSDQGDKFLVDVLGQWLQPEAPGPRGTA